MWTWMEKYLRAKNKDAQSVIVAHCEDGELTLLLIQLLAYFDEKTEVLILFADGSFVKHYS